MKKKYLFSLLICNFLIACGPPVNYQQQYISRLSDRCQSFGYKPNTAEFRNCLMTLDAANNAGAAAAAQQNQNYLLQKSQDYFSGKW